MKVRNYFIDKVSTSNEVKDDNEKKGHSHHVQCSISYYKMINYHQIIQNGSTFNEKALFLALA